MEEQKLPQKVNTVRKGVQTLFLPTSSFTTTLVSMNFYLPLEKETIAQYSLLSELLITCSADYPDYLKLNYKLSDLYGADIQSSVSKVGDLLCVKFLASSINNNFAIGNENIVEQSVKLLLDLIFRPKTVNESFEETDIKREKRKLIDRIKGELNEKRVYANNRLIAEMFEEDSYGAFRLGTVETVSSLDGKALYSAWKKMLETAFVRINVIGQSQPLDVYDRIDEELKAYDRRKITDITKIAPLTKRQEVKRVTEKMNVSQGKLVMGFNAPFGSDEDSLSATVMSDIFGGGPYSRLFGNVREKMSLCYYCRASIKRNKGFMTVDCGVSEENAQKAEAAILEQLEVMKQGGFTDFEFSSSVKSLKDSLSSYRDSQNAMDAWYTLKIAEKEVYSPEEIGEMLDKISREDIISAAKKCFYNTVYMLLPDKENG
ncbi:MAG: insulinase family protein [Ruminococcaceae bacterium]|nr:insulinase family protein [Oscillospiraceae bacterium]